jgi:hypothetical protein
VEGLTAIFSSGFTAVYWRKDSMWIASTMASRRTFAAFIPAVLGL